MWLVYIVVMLNFEVRLFGGGVNETVKQPLLPSHSIATVKVSVSNSPPVMLSSRISG